MVILRSFSLIDEVALFKFFLKSSAVKPPIFIIGVPRSGTTLLRVLLDSHPSIACGPEAPWLARMPLSVKSLYDFMVNNEYGFINNYGMDRELLRKQFSEFINNIFTSYASSRGKKRWAEKTPDHSLEIPFIREIFPNAAFIFIVRDGRDVACSTAILSEERKSISPWHSDNIIISDDKVVPNTLINAALRWHVWNSKIKDSLIGSHFIRVRYEDLISTPSNELKRVLSFLGEEYAPEMLSFFEKSHDYPSWEWGSTDVRKSNEISSRSVRRWMKQLSSSQIKEIETLVGKTLLHFGYELYDQSIES